jgi:hypothetical protein
MTNTYFVTLEVRGSNVDLKNATLNEGVSEFRSDLQTSTEKILEFRQRLYPSQYNIHYSYNFDLQITVLLTASLNKISTRLILKSTAKNHIFNDRRYKRRQKRNCSINCVAGFRKRLVKTRLISSKKCVSNSCAHMH